MSENTTTSHFPAHIQWLVEHKIQQIDDKIKDSNLNLSPDQLLNTLMLADPTEKKKWTQWLLNCWLSKGYLWEDVRAGSESKVAQTLQWFSKFKLELPRDQRNISFYSTLGALYQAVQPFVQDSNNQEQGSREQKRQLRDKAYSESRIIYSDSRVIVTVPQTEQAAKWWGQGTRWCTAADKDNAFAEYSQKAPLIILTVKPSAHLGRKVARFQMWVNKDNSSYQDSVVLMDEADQELTESHVHEFWHEFEPLIKWALEQHGQAIKYVPSDLRNRLMCEQSVENFPQAIESVPDSELTESICISAVTRKIELIDEVLEDFRTFKFYAQVLESNPLFANFIKNNKGDEYLLNLGLLLTGQIDQEPDWKNYKPGLTEVQASKIVEKLPYFLKYIPECYRSKIVVNKALDANASFIKRIIENKCASKALRSNAINSRLYKGLRSGLAFLDSVPRSLHNHKLYLSAVQANGAEIKSIPFKQRNREICNAAMNTASEYLHEVPQAFMDEFWPNVIEQNGDMLLQAPYYFHTFEMCKVAINTCSFRLIDGLSEFPLTIEEREALYTSVLYKEPLWFQYIPLAYRDSKLSFIAVKLDGRLLEFVPGYIRTQELCSAALEQNYLALEFVPPEMRNRNLLSIVEQSLEKIWQSRQPMLDRLEQMCKDYYAQDISISRTI